MDGTPTLGGEAGPVSGQPGLLEGPEGLRVKLGGGGADRGPHRLFEGLDRIELTGYGGGDADTDGIPGRRLTRLSHGLGWVEPSSFPLSTDNQGTLAVAAFNPSHPEPQIAPGSGRTTSLTWPRRTANPKAQSRRSRQVKAVGKRGLSR